MLNLNENENQNEPIPSGTRAMLQMTIQAPEAGTASVLSPALTRSSTSDALYIAAQFEVMAGPLKGRKFFQKFTVDGGKTDDQGRSIAGKISGVFLKAAWDAHKGLVPTDMSQAAMTARMVNDYTDFHGIYFPATIAIRAGNNGYPPRNEIYHVITPDKAEYAKLHAGENVDPLPLGIIGEKKNGAKANAASTSTPPPWATGAAPAAAPAAAAPVNPADNLPFNKPAAAPAAAGDNRPVWAR